MTDSGDTGAPADTGVDTATDTGSTDTGSTDTGSTDTGAPILAASALAGELGGFHCETVPAGGWGLALLAALAIGWLTGRAR